MAGAGHRTTVVAAALPLLILGAFLLGAPNPPLDAARLDIIHQRPWGRAEGVRIVLRSVRESAAPLLFGHVSQYGFAGGSSAGGGGAGQVGNPTGLEYTFLIFLVPLIVAGPLPLAALRAYPRDVATAIASVRAVNAERDRTSGPARES